jgi:predicted esterase
MRRLVRRARDIRGSAIAVLGVAILGAAQALGQASAEGRLLSRPGAAQQQQAAAGGQVGLLTLSTDSASADAGRGALLYVPASYRADHPPPLVVMLHGAGGSPRGGLRPFISLADSVGLILLAPQSQGATWDVVRGRFGPDVTVIDRMLRHVFAHYAVDTTRLAVAGFSDGASYALSLGITNGDLFTHVIAFSPGFMVPARQRGEPRLFVSHGRQDPILSIDRCSRPIVRRMRDAGYDVRYQEFDGGHTVPPEIAREALAWLTAR